VPRSSFAWAGVFSGHRNFRHWQLSLSHALGTKTLSTIRATAFPDLQLLSTPAKPRDSAVAGMFRGWPILVAFFATRVGPLNWAMPSRNNSVIPTEAKRSGGTLCFPAERKRPSCSSRRKAAPFTKGQSRRQRYRETGRFCHPERSNCFAQRSGCGVEGPLPAQIGRRASGNSPMLAPTNSLRQPTSRPVSVPA